MGLKNIAGALIGRTISVGLAAMELGYEIFDRFAQPIEDGQLLVDEGPDDLWPADNYVTAKLSIDIPEREPELLCTQQWGLELPNGEVQWNTWQGNVFTHPIDRAKLVANLQKTAGDIGLPEGQQTEEFLSKYRWVTRNQIATVVYVETGAYSLADSEVFALGTPEVDESSHVDNENLPDAPINGQSAAASVRSGSVGGDAQ